MNTEDYRQPTEPLLRSIDIHDLLPQKEPMVMVGRLIALDETRAVTETEVLPDNLFVEDGCFSASGLIENIAQTCAARLGYANKFILKKDVQIGYIGAIRNLEIMDLPRVGDVIRTTVEVKEEVFGMTLVSASVMCNGHLLATTEITIAMRIEN